MNASLEIRTYPQLPIKRGRGKSTAQKTMLRLDAAQLSVVPISPREAARNSVEQTMPLNLSDEELRAIMNAAAPLHPIDRPAFLQAVASALGAYPPERVGPGLVAQVAKECQRKFRAGKWVA
jgi:hypothetical protein